MRINRINVNDEGLNRFFGPLEARIMELLWSSGELSIREVQSVLSREEPISVNAVMTVMNRLLKKGHLVKAADRAGRDRGATFKPVLGKEQFLDEQMRAVSQGLVQEYGDLIVTHMIDALDGADPGIVAKLEQKINEMKRGKE